jgi:hypothetical protein
LVNATFDIADGLVFKVGYRQLLEQGQSIAGINLFADYESKSKHKRGSVGLEYQRANSTPRLKVFLRSPKFSPELS